MSRLAATLPVLPALLLLSACADPLADIKRLDEVDVAGPAPVVEAVAAPEESDESVGLFQRLMRKRQVAPESEPETANDAADTPPAETVEEASLGAAEAREETGAGRGGWFGGGSAARSGGGASLRDTAPGEILPFGQIARACHAKRGQLGQEVAKYPERGAKYRVFDSAPGSQGLHTFYVTGFSDGCPRQFTAALAVFGSAGMYEALRYGLPVKARTKKPTDIAYEKLKSGKCGVARTKPCGASISRLEKSTVFLSVYNRFEGAQGWSNLLLSDGKVMAWDSQG